MFVLERLADLILEEDVGGRGAFGRVGVPGLGVPLALLGGVVVVEGDVGLALVLGKREKINKSDETEKETVFVRARMSSSEASLRAWAKLSLISAHLRKFSVRARRLAKYWGEGERGAGGTGRDARARGAGRVDQP